MQIRWHEYGVDGKRTVVVEVPGRAIGSWYQDESGIAWIGSGSHPTRVKQQTLQRWAQEGAAPPYELDVRTSVRGLIWAPVRGQSRSAQVLEVIVLNRGAATSYLDNISFEIDFDGHVENTSFFETGYVSTIPTLNPQRNTALEPGRKHTFTYSLQELLEGFQGYIAIWHRDWNVNWGNVKVKEVVVTDEIGNVYTGPLSEATQASLVQGWAEFLPH